jgi:hypothetical protein
MEVLLIVVVSATATYAGSVSFGAGGGLDFPVKDPTGDAPTMGISKRSMGFNLLASLEYRPIQQIGFVGHYGWNRFNNDEGTTEVGINMPSSHIALTSYGFNLRYYHNPISSSIFFITAGLANYTTQRRFEETGFSEETTIKYDDAIGYNAGVGSRIKISQKNSFDISAKAHFYSTKEEGSDGDKIDFYHISVTALINFKVI